MHYNIPPPHSSYQNFWFKIPWVLALKHFRNVGMLIWTKMEICSDLGTLDLSWSGVTPPPQWKFWQILALRFELVWSNPPPPTYVGAGVWRLIAVSPKDTVSFTRNKKDIFSATIIFVRLVEHKGKYNFSWLDMTVPYLLFWIPEERYINVSAKNAGISPNFLFGCK